MNRTRPPPNPPAMRIRTVGCLQMYDPEALPLPSMTYVGHTLLKGEESSELLAREAVRLAGLEPSTLVDLYEQVTIDEMRVFVCLCVGRVV